MCLCKQMSVYCKQRLSEIQLCALPSTASLLCSTPTVLELVDHAVLHSCGRLLVPLWSCPSKTTSWRSSRPPRGVRWRPTAVTCSSGLRGEWPRESGAGSPCWGQCRGASDKSQLGALLLTAGSTVMSILCPVWSPQQEEVQGMDKQDP